MIFYHCCIFIFLTILPSPWLLYYIALNTAPTTWSMNSQSPRLPGLWLIVINPHLPSHLECCHTTQETFGQNSSCNLRISFSGDAFSRCHSSSFCHSSTYCSVLSATHIYFGWARKATNLRLPDWANKNPGPMVWCCLFSLSEIWISLGVLYFTVNPSQTIYFYSKTIKKCSVKVFDLCWKVHRKMSRSWRIICIQTT